MVDFFIYQVGRPAPTCWGCRQPLNRWQDQAFEMSATWSVQWAPHYPETTSTTLCGETHPSMLRFCKLKIVPQWPLNYFEAMIAVQFSMCGDGKTLLYHTFKLRRMKNPLRKNISKIQISAASRHSSSLPTIDGSEIPNNHLLDGAKTRRKSCDTVIFTISTGDRRILSINSINYTPIELPHFPFGTSEAKTIRLKTGHQVQELVFHHGHQPHISGTPNKNAQKMKNVAASNKK